MNSLDRQRLFTALILTIMALFVASGVPFATRWRRVLRLAAILGFALALGAALVEIVWWWIGQAG